MKITNPISNRLEEFLLNGGDLWSWAIRRWAEGQKAFYFAKLWRDRQYAKWHKADGINEHKATS